MFSAILVFIVITSWYLNRGKVPYVSMTWCGLLNFAVVAAVVFSGSEKHPVPLTMMALCAVIATLAWATPILRSQALAHPVASWLRATAHVMVPVALLAPLTAAWALWNAHSNMGSSPTITSTCRSEVVASFSLSVDPTTPEGLPLVAAGLVAHCVFAGIVVCFTWFRARRVPETITALISVWGSAKIALASLPPVFSVSVNNTACTSSVAETLSQHRAMSDASLWLTLVAGVVLLVIAAKDKNKTDEKLTDR